MSVSSTTSSVTYAGNASTSAAYPVPFQFIDATDLVVVVNTGGVPTTLVLGTGYTASGGAGSTGSIVTTSAVPNTSSVIITRSTAKTQLTSYTTGDRFPASTHEKALDKLTMLVQEATATAAPPTSTASGAAPYVLQASSAGANPSWVPQSTGGIAAGAITNTMLAGGITPAKLSTGAPTWATDGSLGIGRGLGLVGTSTDYSNVSITNSGGVQVQLNANGNVEGNLRTVTNHRLSFSTNNTERAVIDTAGNVGIGTNTFAYASTGRTCLEVNGSSESIVGLKSGGTQKAYFFTTSAIASLATDLIPIAIATTGNNAIQFTTNGVPRAFIQGNGSIDTQGNPIINCPTTAKAWVNFTGSGTGAGSQTVNGSIGVSSVTRTAAGRITVNFNAGVFTAANYAFVGMSSQNATAGQGYVIFQESSTAPSTSSCTFSLSNTTNAAATATTVSIAFFGN